MGMAAGKRWNREELLVVLNLYHKLNFAQFDQRQPSVIALATKLDRTPSSVAMKLSNFASLDPVLKLRGIKGLDGASKLDRLIWDELREFPDELIPASEQLFRELFEAGEGCMVVVVPSEGIRLSRRFADIPTETVATVKQRRGQEFFREAVLNNFDGRCGITGLSVRELLIASHVLPWAKYPAERLNVANGLCLSRLHDAAFDRGLIAFDDNLKLVLSARIENVLTERAIAENFGAYEGIALNLPDDSVVPDGQFLARHRTEIFQKE